MAAYADDLVRMAENEASLKDTIRKLLLEGKKMRLTINDDKTKYMVVTKNNHRVGYLDIGDKNLKVLIISNI